jgi:hypothetical protein
MYYANDKKLPVNQGFKLGNLTYPANFLTVSSKEQLETLGITWKEPPVLTFKNEKFYYNTVQDGVVTSTPKDLDGLKRRLTGDANRTAHSMLSGSDWMIVKQTETSTGILPQWGDYRTAVRAEANRQCGQVEEATSIKSLMAITANWPRNPDELAEETRRDAEIEAARLEREEND